VLTLQLAQAESECLKTLIVHSHSASHPAHDRSSAQYPHGVDVVFNFCLPADYVRPAAAALRTEGRLVPIMYPPATTEQLGRDDVASDFIDWNADYGGMATGIERSGLAHPDHQFAEVSSLRDGAKSRCRIVEVVDLVDHR
jgi:hypothetical protein